MKTPKIGMIAHLNFSTRLAVVVAFLRNGKIEQTYQPNEQRFGHDGQYIVFHYLGEDGKLMECPDKERCQHQHTCPLHGANVRAEDVKDSRLTTPDEVQQHKWALAHDIEYYGKNGFIDPEIADAGVVALGGRSVKVS